METRRSGWMISETVRLSTDRSLSIRAVHVAFPETCILYPFCTGQFLAARSPTILSVRDPY
jgi:hypothetical protein